VPLNEAFSSADTKRNYNRRLFSTIADRYDLITAVLSYGQDARWKRRLITEAQIEHGDRTLDLACGTGDIAFAAADRGAQVVGLDLTHRMLRLARDKSTPDQRRFPTSGASRQAPRPVCFLQADMTWLPFPDRAFDLVTTGYGLRNVPDLSKAIEEIARVTRPGGRFLSLDFNKPESALVRGVYLAYLTVVGSVLGWILHGDPDTYRYIPASIRRYPGARGVASMLSARGFSDVRVIPLLGGLMTLHHARRTR
jgi:demethylmenaquinone methyltransferase/2-methoxy-6-polyprenyl-1,4-benzoquinol methylase